MKLFISIEPRRLSLSRFLPDSYHKILSNRYFSFRTFKQISLYDEKIWSNLLSSLITLFLKLKSYPYIKDKF